MNNCITQSKVYRRCNHQPPSESFFLVEVEYDMFFSRALARSGASWVRKFGYLCIQEILVLRRKNNTCYEKTIQVVLNQLCSSLWTSRSWYGVRPYVRSPFHVSGSKMTHLIPSAENLVLDIPVIVSRQLSKRGIRWPVSHGCIVGSGIQVMEAT